MQNLRQIMQTRQMICIAIRFILFISIDAHSYRCCYTGLRFSAKIATISLLENAMAHWPERFIDRAIREHRVIALRIVGVVAGSAAILSVLPLPILR